MWRLKRTSGEFSSNKVIFVFNSYIPFLSFLIRSEMRKKGESILFPNIENHLINFSKPGPLPKFMFASISFMIMCL